MEEKTLLALSIDSGTDNFRRTGNLGRELNGWSIYIQPILIPSLDK